ncbi:hypothetical protein RFI_10786, partial [Reticulomyxa filosa]
TLQNSLLLLTKHQCVEILNGFESVQENAMTVTRDKNAIDRFGTASTSSEDNPIATLLYRIEADAALCRLSVLCQFKSKPGLGSKVIKSNEIKQLAEYRLIPLGIQLIQPQSDIKYLTPVVIVFLQFLLNKETFTDKEFQSKLTTLFPYLVKLVELMTIKMYNKIVGFFIFGKTICVIFDFEGCVSSFDQKPKNAFVFCISKSQQK